MKIVIDDRYVIDICDDTISVSERPHGIEDVYIFEYSFGTDEVKVQNKSGHIVEVQA